MNAQFEWNGSTPYDLADRLEEFKDALADELESALETCALVIQGIAREYAPVDTGRLRQDIRKEVERVSQYVVKATIGNNVEYAKYQEFIYNPYLRPAFESAKDSITSNIADAVNSAAQEVSA